MAKTLSYIFPYLSHPKNVSVNAKVGDRVSCGVEPVFECLVLFLVALLIVVSVLWGGGNNAFAALYRSCVCVCVCVRVCVRERV